MEMWCTSSGGHSHVTAELTLTIGRSPLVTFILLLKAGVSKEVTWFADTLLFRAPIAISAGCRLILSIRQATSSSTKEHSSVSTWDAPCRADAEPSASQGP